MGRIACNDGLSGCFGIGTSYRNFHQSAVIFASHMEASRSYMSLSMSSGRCVMRAYVSPVSPLADLLDLVQMA